MRFFLLVDTICPRCEQAMETKRRTTFCNNENCPLYEIAFERPAVVLSPAFAEDAEMLRQSGMDLNP